jgi:hypothetical protein
LAEAKAKLQDEKKAEKQIEKQVVQTPKANKGVVPDPK